MASKVTCSCGWSWNKSDSSKKDMYVCHQCGKDNTMKDGGWLNKFEDAPDAQNGIEGTMGGLTDKGFNYNGAWGGTMQMGGSLPGSVGFTYARTQSPAPSNGPYAKKTKASAQTGDKVKKQDINEWLTNWYKNRKIPNEQLQSIYEADKPYYLNRLQNIPEVTNVESIDNDPNKTGQYQNDTNKILLTPNAQDNVYLHELSHYADNFPSAMRPIHGNITKANIAPKEGIKGIYNEKYNYFSDPEEVHSRIQVLRKEAGFKPDEKVTPGSLGSFMNNYKGDNQQINDLLNISDFDNLLEMLNYMAANKSNKNSNVAQNGQEMKFYQQGLDFTPKTISKDGGWLSKYDDGGIIEDPMGQWAHPGEITRIPSNEITMQGVNYPVLGISDTGDTKMMQPGEDYTYDGESVTEYPMMQPGGKVKFGQKQKPDPFYNPLEYYQYTGKPIKQPWMPGDEKIKISDKRTMNAAANAAIRPNKDLVTGKYDADRISNIASVAKLYGIDPNLLLSIDLQETGFGTIGEDPGSESIGHTKGYNLSDLKTPSKRGSDEDVFDDRYDFFARAYLEKMAEGKRQGLTDSLDIIQNYNGRGIVTPYTELDYHGFPMKEIYGVPLPEKGISMKQNPLYGKRIFDLRENVVKQNPDLQRLINLAKPTNKPVIEKSQMFEMPASNKKENGGWLNKYK